MGIANSRRMGFPTGVLLLALVHPVQPASGQGDGPASGQGSLQEGRVEVELPTPGESIPVRATYTLAPETEKGPVPISVLTPGPTRLESIRVFVGTTELSVSEAGVPGYSLDAIRDHFFQGEIRVPADDMERPSPDGQSRLSLEFRYTVEHGWSEDGTASVPLLVPRWSPSQPEPETFLAHVAVPEGFTITGSFPTSVLRRPEPGRAGSYEIGLQAPPALLILRVAQGEGSFLTLERGLDIMVVLILLVMGAAGLRYLKGMKR